jgi:hypothetical protein
MTRKELPGKIWRMAKPLVTGLREVAELTNSIMVVSCKKPYIQQGSECTGHMKPSRTACDFYFSTPPPRVRRNDSDVSFVLTSNSL